jgi:hypothetical protein
MRKRSLAGTGCRYRVVFGLVGPLVHAGNLSRCENRAKFIIRLPKEVPKPSSASSLA